MGYRGTRGGAKRSASPEALRQAAEYFASSNADGGSVGDWEVDPEVLAGAIFGVLGDGGAVMLMRGSGGEAVGFRVYMGDTVHTKYYHEAAELEDALRAILGRTQRGKPNPLKAVVQ